MTRGLVAWALLVAAAAGALLASGVARGQQEPTPGDVGRGGELYAVHCAACHAADGRGRTVEGVDVPPLRDVTVAYVRLVLRTQRMPPGDLAGRTKGRIQFSPEDEDAVVAWMTERFGIDGEVPAPPEGDAARGREVFATHCAACHGATGGGGVAGGGAIAPPLVGLDEHTIAMAMRVGPFEMPRFSEAIVSEREGGDVGAYLRFMEAEPTTPIGFVELHPVFASAFVLVLSLVVLLSCIWIAGRVQLFPDRPADTEDAP